MEVIRKVFIGSSSEGIHIARIVADIVKKSEYILEKKIRLEPCLWTYAQWKHNDALINSLLEFPKKYYYSIFIFHPDDKVIVREEDTLRVRDNVLFEFGLFIGQVEGKRKTYIVRPKDEAFVLASDIAGLHMPEYEYKKNDEEFVRNNIDILITGIIRSITLFEQEKINNSEIAVANSIDKLQKSIEEVDSDKIPQLIIDSFKEIIDLKSAALTQTPKEIIKDILTWTNSLLNIIDTKELAKLQKEPLKEVWVYSAFPLEFDYIEGKQTQNNFNNLVHENLSNGVPYSYFIDSDKYLDKIHNLSVTYPGMINIIRLPDNCIISNYAFHFYQNDLFSIFLNVLRKGKIDLLVEMDKSDALVLFEKTNSLKEAYSVAIDKNHKIHYKNAPN